MSSTADVAPHNAVNADSVCSTKAEKSTPSAFSFVGQKRPASGLWEPKTVTENRRSKVDEAKNGGCCSAPGRPVFKAGSRPSLQDAPSVESLSTHFGSSIKRDRYGDLQGQTAIPSPGLNRRVFSVQPTFEKRYSDAGLPAKTFICAGIRPTRIPKRMLAQQVPVNARAQTKLAP